MSYFVDGSLPISHWIPNLNNLTSWKFMLTSASHPVSTHTKKKWVSFGRINKQTTMWTLPRPDGKDERGFGFMVVWVGYTRFIEMSKCPAQLIYRFLVYAQAFYFCSFCFLSIVTKVSVFIHGHNVWRYEWYLRYEVCFSTFILWFIFL